MSIDLCMSLFLSVPAMARNPRVEFPGAPYHAIFRGNHRTEKGGASLYLTAQN
ncbi:MAG: hypothetical protein OEW33_17105 [Nitrospirota bacterium]|nr:hypothetical protein [Nitrospirota bacterium]